MIRIIRVIIDDFQWPMLSAEVAWGERSISRDSVYDTAATNFEPMLTNALQFTVREIIQEMKTNGRQDKKGDEGILTRETPQRVEERPESQKPEAGDRHRVVGKTKRKVK